jgi:hypothetical protein
MTGHTEQIVKLAEAGAGAIVLKSIFEEEIYAELQEELSPRLLVGSAIFGLASLVTRCSRARLRSRALGPIGPYRLFSFPA